MLGLTGYKKTIDVLCFIVLCLCPYMYYTLLVYCVYVCVVANNLHLAFLHYFLGYDQLQTCHITDKRENCFGYSKCYSSLDWIREGTACILHKLLCLPYDKNVICLCTEQYSMCSTIVVFLYMVRYSWFFSTSFVAESLFHSIKNRYKESPSFWK